MFALHRLHKMGFPLDGEFHVGPAARGLREIRVHRMNDKGDMENIALKPGDPFPEARLMKPRILSTMMARMKVTYTQKEGLRDGAGQVDSALLEQVVSCVPKADREAFLAKLRPDDDVPAEKWLQVQALVQALTS